MSKPMMIRAPTATPTPIPAFAPVDRPPGSPPADVVEPAEGEVDVPRVGPLVCSTGVLSAFVEVSCARIGADAGLNLDKSLDAQATCDLISALRDTQE